MAEALVARSPIAPAAPVAVVDGWEVSARRSDAALRVSDLTPLSKVLVRATPGDGVAAGLGVGFARAARDGAGTLVAGSAPGEWLLIGPPAPEPALAERVPTGDDELVTIVDVTHSRALVRLCGPGAAVVLAKLCAIDWSDDVTPDGAALRTSVANLVTDVIRDDAPEAPAYLLHCERSSGQYLFDCLLEAGRPEGVDIDGFAPGAAGFGPDAAKDTAR